MSTELKARAQQFLKRAVPEAVGYVPNSMAEQMIATYARRGKLPDDPETAELLELILMESSALAESDSAPEVHDFFHESAAILEAIQAER